MCCFKQLLGVICYSGNRKRIQCWDVITGVSLPPHCQLLRTRAILLSPVFTWNPAPDLAHSQCSVNIGWTNERMKDCSEFEVLQRLWDSKAGSAFPLPLVLETLIPLISLASCFHLAGFIAIPFAASSLAVDHFSRLFSPACRQNWDGRHLAHKYLTLPTGLPWVMPETVTFSSSPRFCLLSSLLHSCLHSHFQSGFCCFPTSLNGECSFHLIFSFLCSELSTRPIFLIALLNPLLRWFHGFPG